MKFIIFTFREKKVKIIIKREIKRKCHKLLKLKVNCKNQFKKVFNNNNNK